MTNKSKFQNYLAGLGVIYKQQITEPMLDIYWRAFENHEDEAVFRAFDKLITISKFFPKPSEVIEQIDGTEDMQIEDEWITVVERIRDTGAYKSITFADPVTNAVIE